MKFFRVFFSSFSFLFNNNKIKIAKPYESTHDRKTKISNQNQPEQNVWLTSVFELAKS